MSTVIISGLALFFAFHLPGWLLARRLPQLSEEERLATGFGLTAIVAFLIGFAAYLSPFPQTMCAAGALALLCALAIGLNINSRREAGSALLRHWQLALLPLAAFLFYLTCHALLPFPALGDWHFDWWLNHELTLFHLERQELETRFLNGLYSPLSRPPMFNLCSTFIMALIGKSYAHFQLGATVLSTAWIMPAYLLARRFLPQRRALAVSLLLLCSVFIFKNITYTWPKLFCAYFILMVLHFYLEWLAGVGVRRATTMILAICAFFAAYMIHQMALLFMAPVFVHFLWILYRRRIAFPLKATLLALPVVVLLVAPYHLWIWHEYGFEKWLKDNPAVFYAERKERSFISIRASNVFSTIFPVVYGKMSTFGLSNQVANYSRTLAVYYKTIPGNAGLTALLGLMVLLFVRNKKRTAPLSDPPKRAGPYASHLSFTAWIFGGAFFFLVGGHPKWEDWGLASVGLAPAMILALPLIFGPLLARPWSALAILIGVTAEFCIFCWGLIWVTHTRFKEIQFNDSTLGYIEPNMLNLPNWQPPTLATAQQSAFAFWLMLGIALHVLLLYWFWRLIQNDKTEWELGDADELLPIIDDGGAVIGLERRELAHKKGLKHASIHAMIFNSSGELLIQQRAEDKDCWPGHWDTSVGGHVNPGESYEQTLARELDEELGLIVACRHLRDIEPAETTGWEHVRQYDGCTDETPQPNLREIADWTFIAPENLLREIEEDARSTTPALRNLLNFHLARSKEHTP